MDVSNINSDNIGKHVDGKSKRFTLCCVFETEIVEFSYNFLQVY